MHPCCWLGASLLICVHQQIMLTYGSILAHTFMPSWMHLHISISRQKARRCLLFPHLWSCHRSMLWHLACGSLFSKHAQVTKTNKIHAHMCVCVLCVCIHTWTYVHASLEVHQGTQRTRALRHTYTDTCIRSCTYLVPTCGFSFRHDRWRARCLWRKEVQVAQSHGRWQAWRRNGAGQSQ